MQIGASDKKIEIEGVIFLVLETIETALKEVSSSKDPDHADMAAADFKGEHANLSELATVEFLHTLPNKPYFSGIRLMYGHNDPRCLYLQVQPEGQGVRWHCKLKVPTHYNLSEVFDALKSAEEKDIENLIDSSLREVPTPDAAAIRDLLRDFAKEKALRESLWQISKEKERLEKELASMKKLEEELESQRTVREESLKDIKARGCYKAAEAVARFTSTQ